MWKIAKANLQKNNSNKYYYTILGFSICSVTLGKPFARVCFCTDFLHRFFARIFCTDVLHGFSARIFGTDFLHGFSAQIFCTVFCPIFLRGFLHGLLARIVCTDVARVFARIFGVSQNTCWEAPKFHRENPPCFGGLLGRGSGGRRVR